MKKRYLSNLMKYVMVFSLVGSMSFLYGCSGAEKDAESIEGERAQIYFSCVDELVKSESLIQGQVYETQGFYKPGDGGAAKYLISDSVTDEYKYGDSFSVGGMVQEIESGGYALLLPENGAINVKQVGAVGDGEYIKKEDGSGSYFQKGSDDTQAFQELFNLCGLNGDWKIIIPDGHYCVDSIELTEGGCYLVEGVNALGDPYNDISGHNCTIHSYGDNLFTGSFERRWKETSGQDNQGNYKRPTYVTLSISGLEMVNESEYENASVFSNMILRASNVESNLARGYAIIFKGGFDWTTKIDNNYIVGIRKAFVGPTDLECYQDWEQRAIMIDSYIENNYINAAPSSGAVVFDLGGSGDMDFMNSSNNFYDFFKYLVMSEPIIYKNENGENAKAHGTFSDMSFMGDTFDYFVRLLGSGETIMSSSFVGCKYTHMSRDYIQELPLEEYSNEVWGPFVLDNSGMVNVIISDSYVKACDGFFSCSKEVGNIPLEERISTITFLQNVKIKDTIFGEMATPNFDGNMRNEAIKFFYAVTDQFVADTNKAGFECDDLEYQKYENLPQIYDTENKVFYFYEGQHIIYQNKELRCDGLNWIDSQGTVITG